MIHYEFHIRLENGIWAAEAYRGSLREIKAYITLFKLREYGFLKKEMKLIKVTTFKDKKQRIKL